MLRVRLVAEPLTLGRAPPSHSLITCTCFFCRWAYGCAGGSVGQSGIMTVPQYLDAGAALVACMCVTLRVCSDRGVFLRFGEDLTSLVFSQQVCAMAWRRVLGSARLSPKLCEPPHAAAPCGAGSWLTPKLWEPPTAAAPLGRG